jgi:hypothetical protein
LVDATFGGGDGIITTDLTPSSVGACGANSVKIDGADNIYVAGWSKQGTNSDFVLLKYSGTDGSLISRVFSDFAGGNDSATDLSIHLDKVYLCGTAKNGGQNYFGIASFTTSLSPNSTFNFGSPLITSIQGIGRSLVVNHVIYMTGISNNTGALEFTTASYELNGNENSTFGGGVVSTDINGSDDYSRSILLQCDGKIVVGGESKMSTGRWHFSAVRYDQYGVLDNGFSGDGKAFINTGSNHNDYGFSGLAIQPSGKLLLGGISFIPLFYNTFYPKIIRFTNAAVFNEIIQPGLSGGGVFCAGPTINVGVGNIVDEQTYEWIRNGTSTVKGPQDGDGGGQSYQAAMSAAEEGTYVVYSKKEGCPISVSNPVTVYLAEIKGLATTAITSTSVSFTWTALGSSAKYQYAVDLNSAPPATGTTTTTNSITVNVLSPGTTF